MTQEQKARAYYKAIEMAKTYLNTTDSVTDAELVELIFPELKESEDERIRKAIITCFQRFPYERIDDAGTNVKEVIAWLEKQGNKDMGISEATKQELEDNLNKALEKETSESLNEFLDEQKPAEWSKLDNRIEDCIGMCLTDISEKRFDDFKTSLKECLDWLHSLKDRIWYQHAQEWSEDDKRVLGNILFDLETLRKSAGTEKEASPYQKEIDWLKSLRPQNTWKPSEEQMDALRYVTNFDYGGGIKLH